MNTGMDLLLAIGMQCKSDLVDLANVRQSIGDVILPILAKPPSQFSNSHQCSRLDTFAQLADCKSTSALERNSLRSCLRSLNEQPSIQRRIILVYSKFT